MGVRIRKYGFIVLALLWLLGFSPVLFAQNQIISDSAEFEAMYSKSLELLDRGNAGEALMAARSALNIAMQAEMEDAEIKALLAIGDINVSLNNHEDALPYYLRAANVLEYAGKNNRITGIYNKIASSYRMEKVYDKEIEYYLKALSTLQSTMKEEKKEFLRRAGEASLNNNQPDSAIHYFHLFSNLLSQSDSSYPQSLILLNRAHREAGNFDSCIYYSSRLFDIYEEANNLDKMSAVKNNLGYYHTLEKEYELALENYLLAIDYGKQADLSNRDIALMYANSGICYQNMNAPGSAKYYFKEAISLLKNEKYAAERSRIQNILALIYYNENDLYNAGFFSKNAIASAEEAVDYELISQAYYTYSRVLRAGNDSEKALDYYEHYLIIRDSLEMHRKMKEQDLERKKEELEKAENELQLRLKEEKVKELAIQQLSLKLEKEEQEKALLEKENDLQLMEQERLRQSLVIAEKTHLVEKRERENRILEQEQKIANLRIEQEERKQKEQKQEISLLEQQQRLDQLELEKQATTKKALFWIAGLMILVALLILGSLIMTRRKNLLLAKQKTEIEEKNTNLEQKNEEISAQRDEIEAQRNLVFDQKEAIEQFNAEIIKSIEYAMRIQSSTLPDLNLLKDHVRDHFLMFRPRDVVSGDFYWLAHIEGKTVVIVSDCTGHGVPGAFMSILGMSLLKEIILKEYITHPGVILRRLRKEIINTLGQKGISGEQRDGMDMAIVVIDHENQGVEYAGAYNSMYLVRNSKFDEPEIQNMKVLKPENGHEYKLFEIPADKMPVAHYERMDRFTTHEISYQSGDQLYLFSDGYADQFGGERGKKFMYKPFKRLILSNAAEPMDNQKKIMETTLDEWMKNYEQVDDICIMGIRL